jgi:flavin reductase (DIM6/NTAB) family NADH-FMN oxidoreductase RutF
VISAGDHVIITGNVLEVEAAPGDPLVYHGGLFRRLEDETPEPRPDDGQARA